MVSIGPASNFVAFSAFNNSYSSLFIKDLFWAFACFAVEIEAFSRRNFLLLFDFYGDTLIWPSVFNS